MIKTRATILFATLFVVSLQSFAQTNYFPVGSLDDRADVDAFVSSWYSKDLSAMSEPSFASITNDVGAECYRLLYLPTWGHPVAVRVASSGEVFMVHSTVLSGYGGYDPGTISNQSCIVMEKQDSDELRKIIAKVDLFKMRKTDEIRGCDGEEWVFEWCTDGKYGVVTRWCPTDMTRKRGLNAFVSMCLTFLNLAKDQGMYD